ncbi:MAG: acyl-CoA thioesterase [Gemmatimonadota bacterium]
MIGSVEVRVRYAETDQMGRAHHSNYLIWCELGRTALMRDAGISYADLERGGLLLPVTRAELEYLAPLLYDEVAVIETWVERVRSRDIVFAYRVIRATDGVVAATARTVLVSANAQGRPARMPVEIREALQRLLPEG